MIFLGNNYSGELFLDTLFKDLYKSKEVLNGKIHLNVLINVKEIVLPEVINGKIHLNDFVKKEEFNIKTK